MRIAEILRKLHETYEEKRKEDNGYPIIRYFLRPVSFPVSAVLIAAGVSANQATLINLLLLGTSGTFLMLGTSTSLAIGAMVLLLCYIFDCVDGNIARYNLRSNFFGKVFDGFVDTSGLLIFIPIVMGCRKIGFLGEEGFIMGVWISAIALLNAYVVQRIAHYSVLSKVRSNEQTDEREVSAAASGTKIFKGIELLYGNLITATPLILLLGLFFKATWFFLGVYFVVHIVLGFSGSVARLVMLSRRVNRPWTY